MSEHLGRRAGPADPRADLELAFLRALAERRISRRQLLETAARLGPVAAIAPILAACGGATTPQPSSAAPSSVNSTGAGPSAAPSPSASAEPTAVPSAEAELNVYNWDAYIGEKTVAAFEAATNIKVHYDKFPDAETMLAKIRSDGKGAGYDICYPTSVEIPGLAADGVIQPLKLDLIPNAANLGAQWQNPGYDPGNKSSMPYMWWTTGYCWDGDRIKDDLTSWTALWDSAYKGKLTMLDDIRETFAVAAFRLGLDPNTKSDADLDRMVQLLEEQKPLVRTYTTDDIGVMTGKQAVIAHAWSGDVYQMYDDVPNVKYVIPSEGAVRGSDTMVVLSGAPHPIAANLWINFNLDAQVSAGNTNFIGYMGPNAAAMQYIKKEILSDATVNPDIAIVDKLVELLNIGPDLDKYTQRWNALKA
ncbi:MAG TPA: spermidine/putrescine ABC transporter substrate-binding protein [Candidatus Limnocylindrales bacterium]|jgi:spermidine/putrescine transport system substrate-binding protein|nr:spermidine/putrescine ABC transporter substrate-binding protein [Candidatus Limnocylindrales bacterium]